MLDLTIFERYRDLIDDWDAFTDSLHRPLPGCVWANTLRTTPAELEQWLERLGLMPQPLTWCEGAFRLGNEQEDIGTKLPYLVGLMHTQEEVSLIPSWVLGVQPGDRVLDTCAAPGGKTAHMAVQMENRGTIIANDRSFGRLRALRNVIDRFGLLNISMMTYDAANFPRAIGRFDRALVDVPCSCEGTTRKNPRVLEKCKRFDYVSMGRLQQAILRRALEQVRPGGSLVYSTCSYAPEENEMVVQAALDEFGWERVSIEPIALPGFTTQAGLEHWAGKTFHPSMRNAIRAWPHHNDSGGFFVALIRRVDTVEEDELDDPGEYAEIKSAPCDKEWAILEERFGITADALERIGAKVYRQNRKVLSIVGEPHEPSLAPPVLSSGMPFMRLNMKFPKLTTAATLTLGHMATRNVIELTEEQLDAYLSRRPFFPDVGQLAEDASTGYVVLSFEGITVGLGLFYTATDERPGKVESLYPKAQANRADRAAASQEESGDA